VSVRQTCRVSCLFWAVVVERFAGLTLAPSPISVVSNDFREGGGELLLLLLLFSHDILMIGMAWENTLLASRILPPAYTPIEVATNRSQDASLMLEQGNSTANLK
jgi:hypothetical protein